MFCFSATKVDDDDHRDAYDDNDDGMASGTREQWPAQ